MIMSEFLSSAGKVYFEEEGKGEPLIFIHGRTLDHRMWKPQIEFFKSDYRCISYDLNGFGKSQIPKNNYSRAQTLKDLLDYLNIKKSALIGLSLGSYTALEFLISFPEYVNKVVLMSPAVPGAVYSNEFNSDWEKVSDYGKKGELKLAKKYWLMCKAFSMLKTNNSPGQAILEKIIKEYTGWDIQQNPPESRTLVENAFKHLEKIQIPALMIYGEGDYNDFGNNAKLLHNELKNSKLIKIKNSSHMVNLEFPDLVNNYIKDFLSNPKE